MDNERKAKLLKPLMHSRLGKIDYTNRKDYEDYCEMFSTFGLVVPNDGNTCSINLRDWLANHYHDASNLWYLSRGQRQSVSFRSNRIEEHADRVVRNFQKISPVQWVYEVASYDTRGGSPGYVMASSSEEAEQLGKMMYHLQGSVWVRRKTPAFDKSKFCDYQTSSVKCLQKQIERNLYEIQKLQEKNDEIKESITTLQTNLMIFLDA